MSDQPKIRVYQTEVNGPVWHLPTCCNDPAPEAGNRFISGDTIHQYLYCRSCNTDWLEFAWKTRQVAEAGQHE